MPQTVFSGLDVLLQEEISQKKIPGKIGLLCHSASIDRNLELGVIKLKQIFGERLIKLFGPQHGFVTDVQDNMVETKDFFHPYFKLTIHSLYSETRIPTDKMLEGLDSIIVDLQDVGTRIYTYIYTLTLLMEACGKKGIKVIVLDRPNPINASTIEGNILDLNFASFVGRHPLPVRHALTMGEVAMMGLKYWGIKCDVDVIKMKNYRREMSFEETGLPWVLPSPNLATVEAAYTFVGTVLYEGTNISEGRGTTRSLEIIGHPKIEPFSFLDKVLTPALKIAKLEGFILRPLHFLPTFQKHKGVACGGYQIHVTNRKTFQPWRLNQILCREFYHHVEGFEWKLPPYEYEHHKMPVDLINGTDFLRHWVEKNGNHQELDELEQKGMSSYLEQRKSILLY